MKVGVIHGRFQLLHNDHLKYLLAGKERCDHLVIGITNPDPTLTHDDTADPGRSSRTSNPFTYYERYCMVRAAMAEQGALEEISIVPFPINFPDLYRYYVPLDAVFFLTIYDDWGEKKLRMFQQLGLFTEILWRRPSSEKGLSASAVRRKIVCKEEWHHLVPLSVARLVETMHLRQRLLENVASG
ncbi:MAG: nicotinate-nucleotide adenylyltransferase [Pseudomonadota bacterium]